MNAQIIKRRLSVIISVFLILTLVCYNNAYAELATGTIVVVVGLAGVVISVGKWVYSSYQNIQGRVDVAATFHGQKDIIQDRVINASGPETERLKKIVVENQELWSDLTRQAGKEYDDIQRDFVIDSAKNIASQLIPMSPTTDLVVTVLDAANDLRSNLPTWHSPNADVDEAIQRTRDMKERWGTQHADDAASEEAYWMEQEEIREREEARNRLIEKREQEEKDARITTRTSGHGRITHVRPPKKACTCGTGN